MGHPNGASRRRSLVCVEQKSYSLMIYLLRMLYSPEGTISDVCKGPKSTADTCLPASKNFKFFECNADNFFLSKLMPFILEVFASLVLNVGSDINEPWEIQKVTRSYLQRKSCAVEYRRKDVYRASQWFSAVHFPHHITFKLSQCFDNMDLFTPGILPPCTL